jgi:hypothetical protein
MIFLIAVLVFSLLSNSIQCQTLQEDLASITTNPLEALQDFENKITNQAPLLSLEERELLIRQLETIKKQLCTRLDAGILTLPLIATIVFGLKAYFDYQYLKPTESIILELIIDRKKAGETFFFDLCAFIIGACTTFLVNVEYRESVKHLFKKEHMLEIKINKIINDLKAAKFLSN